FHCFFFFQAEDGIRDRNVTGVQTCALPICLYLPLGQHKLRWKRESNPCARFCRPLPHHSAIPPWRTASGTLTANRKRTRADDETRTRDPHLGKVMRYQLRYIRISRFYPWCAILGLNQ